MGESDLVFIIGRQRSGTTVFRRLLWSAGAIDCDEIFHGNLDKKYRFYKYVAKQVAKDPQLVVPLRHAGLFNAYMKDMRQEADGRKLAMDVKYFALNLIPAREDVDNRDPFLLRFMRREKAHVVHIVRRNKLRIYISEEMAKATGKWSAGKVDQLVTEKPKLAINVKQALTFIERQNRQERRVRSMLDRVPGAEELIYEDMFEENGDFASRTRSVASMCMGGKDVDLTPGNVKMNPEGVRDLVENYAELAEAIGATEHAWMLTHAG